MARVLSTDSLTFVPEQCGDNIIVAEQVNHRVQVLSRQGGYLRHFGREGSLDHQLDSPTGLSIDSDCNIIVPDKVNRLIKIFSTDGQFLNKLGTDGSFTKPFHCIQHDNYLMVTHRDDHSVKFFDRKGNFLYKFGKKGNADGEYNDPFCLSVDKAGHLLVCYSENHRIQVFDLSWQSLRHRSQQPFLVMVKQLCLATETIIFRFLNKCFKVSTSQKILYLALSSFTFFTGMVLFYMCMLNQYLFTMLLLKTLLRTKKEEDYKNNIFVIMSCFPSITWTVIR